MKILHLYSDWKWTGPAEPVLQMCRSLQDLGHDVLLAYRADQFELDETVDGKAAELGLCRTTRFALDRYCHPAGLIHDLWSLPRFLSQERFDILHMHLSHDHTLGGLCAKLARGGSPLLVRSLHRRNVLEPSAPSRFLLKRFTHGCLTFTEGFRERYVERFGLDPDCVGVQPMTVDLDRFKPGREFRDMRSEYGIEPSAPVIGIVGRYQKYRRAEVFLEAAAKVLAVVPSVRFLVIGRSSQMPHTVLEPMKRLGIEEQVILPGYRTDDYVDTLACLDIFTLLIPGYDGTARAVREAMALGKPCVVSDFGMLPDMVPHGEAGLVAPIDADSLATAWLQLIQDPAERRRMGSRARELAESRFRVDLVGPCLTEFYERLLGRHRLR